MDKKHVNSTLIFACMFFGRDPISTSPKLLKIRLSSYNWDKIFKVFLVDL